jgi:CBS domain-containing protein
MSQPVVSIGSEQTVAEAIQVLTRQHTGSLPVTDVGGHIVGMISEMELLDVAFDRDIKNALVSEFMSHEVQVVQSDEPLSQAAQSFALFSFRRLPVVENGKLVGIVSRRDLMNYALRTDDVLVEPLMELIPSLAPLS